MLQDFLTENRDAIITRTRAKVAGRSSPRATEHELENGVPLFLNQFIETLGAASAPHGPSEAMGKSAAAHGGTLLRMGFTVAQVVYDYGDVCQAVTELADETGSSISATEFHTLNRCLDEAIAQAVTEYQNLRDQTIVHRETEHLSELAHEMRSRLSATMLSFDLLRKGSVGIAGSTGAALGRGLSGLRTFLDAAFARVRLDSGARLQETISVPEFLDGIAADAAIGANARGVTIVVEAAAPGTAVVADRHLLEAAVSRLMQNAIKYSPLRGHARLRSSVAGDRVLIEIHDECGGLSPGEGEALAHVFGKKSAGETKAGLGLSMVRDCVEALGGAVRARDVPAVGCVLTIDLPILLSA